jgi:hypothetical protein
MLTFFNPPLMQIPIPDLKVKTPGEILIDCGVGTMVNGEGAAEAKVITNSEQMKIAAKHIFRTETDRFIV